MRLRVILASVAMVALIGFVTAQTTKSAPAECKKTCFVDANNNGVCDKSEEGNCKKCSCKAEKKGEACKKGETCGSECGKCTETCKSKDGCKNKECGKSTECCKSKEGCKGSTKK